MSNFTRSILYSTIVLVAGLVSIVAIYNNVTMSPNASDYAQIAPTAGESTLGIHYDKAQTVKIPGFSSDTPADDYQDDVKALDNDGDVLLQNVVDAL